MHVTAAHSRLPKTDSLSDQVLELISAQRFGVEYQPIIEVASGEVRAYEALARFYLADGQMMSSQQVFAALHHDHELLAHTELMLKKLQLAEAPKDYTLFINLDPHAVDCDAETSVPRPCLLMSEILTRDNLVVELIENSDIHEARKALRISELLKRKGIETALDDIGADHALLSLEILLQVDYLKFDRSWLTKLEQEHYEQMLMGLLVFAGNSRKRTVLEGIENEQHLAMAKMHGIEAVQGFLFQQQFIDIKP